jgi:hypothetical protein
MKKNESAKKQSGIIVRDDIAKVLGMSPEAASMSIGSVLKNYKIPSSGFMSVLLEKGKPILCTTVAIIEWDFKMDTSRVLRASVKCVRSSTRRNFSVCPSGSLRK